uniref:Uncharacterized protein n=1 Tax=Denticeps clupeoides TaxID=299321 RepID=A0AAY4BM97_9TELE
MNIFFIFFPPLSESRTGKMPPRVPLMKVPHTRCSPGACHGLSWLYRCGLEPPTCQGTTGVPLMKVPSPHTRWFLRTGSWEKRRFLTGILLRCADAALLSRVHDVLHATRGKDVTYARSRPGVRGQVSARRAGDSREPEMRDTWDWFGRCPVRTQTQYLMGILSQCDMELLRMMGNPVVRGTVGHSNVLSPLQGKQHLQGQWNHHHPAGRAGACWRWDS